MNKLYAFYGRLSTKISVPITLDAHQIKSLAMLAALLYLALPNVIFVVSWLQWPFASIGALAASYLVWAMARGRFARESFPIWWLLPLLVLAFSWAALGGAGHFFYSNWFDWHVRDQVLHDLVVRPWPVVYQLKDSYWLGLKCPLGYYLPVAALSKVAPILDADKLLYIWTGLGVFITFWLAAVSLRIEKFSGLLIFVFLFIFFSGMDYLGYTIRGLPPHLFDADHLEWWAKRYQYSSNTTLLFWVPNHALPAWILGCFLYRYFTQQDSQITSLISVASFSLLWSPLVVLGAVPLLAASGIHFLWKNGLRFNFFELLACVVIAALSAHFLILGASDVAQPGPLNNLDVQPTLGLLLLFCFIEFALIWCFLVYHKPSYWLILTGASLFILPLFSYGPGNDLTMRGGVPAMTILLLGIFSYFRETRPAPWSRVKKVMFVALVVGVITPLHEMIRAFSEPVWQPKYEESLEVVLPKHPAHYFGYFGYGQPILRDPH